MDNFEQFASELGLNDEQKKAVRKFILSMMVENLKAMKEEYNNEIDSVITSLSGE